MPRLRKPTARLATIIIAVGALCACPMQALADLSPVMALSVSADGRYAVSTHSDNELVLWDLRNQQHQVLTDDTNIYSAYFIRGRNALLWQDLDNTVHVQRVDGKELEHFTQFPVYGHVMSSDLQTYVAVDEGWGIYVGKGQAAKELKAPDGRAFLGFGKLLNLTLDSEQQRLLSAGYGYNFDDKYTLAEERARDHYRNVDGVALWSLDTLKPLHKFPGNASKTYATLSPDGQYVVSGDENRHSFVWNSESGELAYRTSSLGAGVWTGDGYDKSDLHIRSDDQFPADYDDGLSGAYQSINFVSADMAVATITYEPYALLYKLGDPYALKFLDLGKDPFPSVSSYDRNASIDSAPDAHILVTGQRDSGGINVYRYDPDKQTLKRIWAPTP